MQSVIVVPERFRGPPQSGNGGYVSGLLAALLVPEPPALQRPAAEVTLRSPVPLDRPLALERASERLRVMDGERLIAEAQIASLELSVPEPPSFAEALAVRDSSLALRVGPHLLLPGERVGVHPICFCCGAELPRDDGLHVYAAPLPDRQLVAAAWEAPAAFASADGTLPPEIVCTALDCPGQFAWMSGGREPRSLRSGSRDRRCDYAQGLGNALLGRMTQRLERPVHAAERCVVIGWTMGQEGRKHYAGTALFNSRLELCAYAKAVWISF